MSLCQIEVFFITCLYNNCNVISKIDLGEKWSTRQLRLQVPTLRGNKTFAIGHTFSSYQHRVNSNFTQTKQLSSWQINQPLCINLVQFLFLNPWMIFSLEAQYYVTRVNTESEDTNVLKSQQMSLLGNNPTNYFTCSSKTACTAVSIWDAHTLEREEVF